MTPDYASYNLQQLRSARSRIDSARLPERTRELDERIAALELHGEPALAQSAPRHQGAAGAIVARTAAVLAAVGAFQLVVALAQSSVPGAIRFELLYLILGALVYFGGFRAVSAVRWLAWFSILPALFALVNAIAFVPLDLTLTHARLHPAQSLMLHGPLVLQIVLSAWIARQLGRAPLLAERAAAGRKRRDMRVPLALGAVLALASSSMMYQALNSEDAQRASTMAAQQGGPRYRYQAFHVHYQHVNGSKTVIVSVAAWNDKEVINIPVRWQE